MFHTGTGEAFSGARERLALGPGRLNQGAFKRSFFLFLPLNKRLEAKNASSNFLRTKQKTTRGCPELPNLFGLRVNFKPTAADEKRTSRTSLAEEATFVTTQGAVLSC